jgi:hypothetical protein
VTAEGPDGVVVRVSGDDVAPAVAAAVVGAGYRLHGLAAERRTLEDLYIQLVSEGEQ